MQDSSNNKTKQGRVDLSGLDFVRIKCIFIAALVIRIVILRTEQVTMRKMHLNESFFLYIGDSICDAFLLRYRLFIWNNHTT